MKVVVDSNLAIQGLFEPPVELSFNGESHTLKGLLEKVGSMCSSIQLLKDGAIGDDIRNIIVNGKEYFDLPQGLATALKDGDHVHLEIYMEPLGGG